MRCLWQDGEIVDVGTLGGTFGVAIDINPRGQAVGVSNRQAKATSNSK